METETDLMRIMMEDCKPTKKIILEDDIQKIRIFSEYDFPLRLTKLSKIGTNMEYQSDTRTLFVTTGLNCFCLCLYRDTAFWNSFGTTRSQPKVALEVVDESQFQRFVNMPNYIESRLNTGDYIKKEFYDKTYMLEEPTGKWGTKVFSCTLYELDRTRPEPLFWTLTKKFVHNSVPQKEFSRWMWGNCTLSRVSGKYSESKLQEFLLDTSSMGLTKFNHGDICYALLGEMGHVIPMDGAAKARTWMNKRRFIVTDHRWPIYRNLLNSIREEVIEDSEDEDEELFQDLWGTYHFLVDRGFV